MNTRTVSPAICLGRAGCFSPAARVPLGARISLGARIRRIAPIAALLLSAMWLAGCQAARSFELQTSKFLIPHQQEAELGREFSVEIEKEAPLLANAAAQRWVDQVGRKLLAQSPASPLAFTFKVTAAEEINAFALPGGYCYINVGLIRAAQNEAEVAAVIAHEINHVTTRHGARSMQRAVGIDLLSKMVQAESEGGQLAVQALKSAGGVLAMRGFSREDEREADSLAVEAMYKAGYDPRAMIAFFEKLHELEKQYGAGDQGLMARLIATHPTTLERISNIRKQVAGLDLSRPMTLNTPAFEQMKAGLKR